ncbi:PREDICTED: cyclin-dependent protein kinase inhibitor SMR1 [Populus euphratica]|uniref:Cyclin-dependent protein kinase inhibitor SMR1 n=1 Tax=Populus euphratica TaxID=75702 RepID=A0AAJ6U8A4_POPEU|nr:PREDICTED: cyclin-dependent protein kinase inhibitor SMR1 [Populus euphratica]
MSSDQELFQSLPKLGLKVIKTTRNDDGGDDDCEHECCTPTSAQLKIPALLTCPPAPKKPPRSPDSWKRKQSNLHFFEVMNREEVDLFFRSSKKVGFASGVVD